MDFSTLAEVDISGFDLDEAGPIHTYLKYYCSFEHDESYEFILYLHPLKTEEWFIKNCLPESLPNEFIKLILEARKGGASRIWLYA